MEHSLQKYILEFTIPRNLELDTNLELNNSNDNFEVRLSIVERILDIPGINRTGTTALFINEEDRFGDNVKTRLKAKFVFNKDIFNDDLDNVSLTKDNPEKTKEQIEDWMSGKRNKFFIHNILKLVNQLIETHQYVNNKYSVFPIDSRSLYQRVVELPNNQNIIIGAFGGGKFAVPNQAHHLELANNSQRISDFINNKDHFFEPLRIMKYSIEFYKMGLLRIAITEAQSAIEHLLTIRYFEIQGIDFPMKILKKGKKVDYNFIEKLEEFSKIQSSFDFSQFKDQQTLKDAKRLRNDIIHGKETPLLNPELCLKYITVYDALFKEIYLSKKS
ncbi:MAG: hypothetical protein WCV90_07235 [Candidatus Woesearchaeota archaeon]